MDVTLYVPEELGKEIQALKKDLRLSKLFQRAVREEIDRLRLVSGGGVRRLEDSKKASDKYWKEQGNRDGMSWALDESDFDTLALVARAFRDYGGAISGSNIEQITSDIEETCGIPEEELFLEDDQLIPNRPAYLRGFLQGATSVYARVA